MTSTPIAQPKNVNALNESSYCQELFARKHDSLEFIMHRRAEIMQRVQDALSKSGRSLDEAVCMAVTKHVR